MRSNYLLSETSTFFEFSLKLWEGFSQELNYNVMFSPEAWSTSSIHRRNASMLRRQNAMRLNGIDADILSLRELRDAVPALDTSSSARFPVHGAVIQRRAGTARHDAVAWGYARAADSLGVDIIENCEVLAIGASRRGSRRGHPRLPIRSHGGCGHSRSATDTAR